MKSILYSLLSLLIVSCTKNEAPQGNSPDDKKTATAGAHEDPNGYFTCAMHPQVHKHEAGPCPICGMALIKVQAKDSASKAAAGAGSVDISATDTQLALAGIDKQKVIKKDLDVVIPVSGRFLSGSEIAFQVYESDLGVIKAGASFSGLATSAPTTRLSGSIVFVERFIDPSSRTSRVVGKLSQTFQNAAVDGGFHGEVRITLKSQIAIPEDAVLHTGLSDLVYVIDKDNKLQPKQVTLGKKAGDEYQVLSGLSEGEMITRGSNFLIDSEAKIKGPSQSDSTASPKCPEGERWDVPMSMCMPSGPRK